MSKDILFEMVANMRGGIDPSPAMQAAIIETAGLAPGTDFRIEFDPYTKRYKGVFRYWKVVPDETDFSKLPETVSINQMPLSQAKKHNPSSQVGHEVSKEIHFSRIEFQKFKHLFNAEMQKAERNRIAEVYRPRIGTVFVGTIRRQQFSRDKVNVILELDNELDNGIELLLPHEEMIPKEEIRLNDRIYVYLYEIDTNAKGPQLLVSRKAPELLQGLFQLKILEVESGVIEVKSVARDPGFRAKVAVKTNDGRLNPIGTCIGRSGERVQAISNELNDEHIDIILWDDNPAQLAIHALAPAEVISIAMDEDTQVMDIAVKNEDLPRAIGRNGQNVRLASQLTGWTLNIMSADEAKKKSIETSNELEALFIEQLSIESEQAQKLVQNGFTQLEDIAYASVQALASVLALEEPEIENLISRVNDILLAKAFATESASLQQENTEDESLDTLTGVTPELLAVLEKHNINSREALAELSIDDLLEIASLSREKAGQLIMNARAHWFTKSTTA